MYDDDAKQRMVRLEEKLSPEVVEALACEIVRLGPEALKLCLTFPEPLVYARTRHWIKDVSLRMPREESVPVLMEALTHPDWRIYQIARDALALMGHEVRDELLDCLNTCGAWTGRLQSLWCLQRLADPLSPLNAERSEADLSTDEWHGGADIPVCEGDRSLIPHIARHAAEDPSPEVRAAAVEALSRCEAPPSTDPSPLGAEGEEVLVAALADADEGVQRAAVKACGRMRLKKAVDPLRAMLSHPEGDFRADVLYALDLVGDASAAADVRRMTTDPDPYVRWAAVKALERLWDEANVPALSARVRDDDEQVAIAALETLATKSPSAATHILNEAAATGDSSLARTAKYYRGKADAPG